MPYAATLINSHNHLMGKVSWNSARLGAPEPALPSPSWVASSISHTLSLGHLSPVVP